MNQLVITGMHRSGTSLLANAAERAGISMGDQILASGKGNLAGHFEDAEIVRFHENFLESRGWSALWPPDEIPVPSPAERRAARGLVEARAGKLVWGFKDPRAALLLDFWAEVLDDPFFLLVYRHPIEVVLSLLRRGIDLDVQSNPGSALKAWTIHNRLMLEFRRAHPERCLLWNVYGATRSLTSAFRMLEQRMQQALAADAVAGVFQGRYLQAGLAAADIRWEALLPEVFSLYGELEKEADLPDPRDQLGRAEPPDRDLREVAEHLLAAVLGAPPGREKAPATERVAYSDLRQLNFQHEQRTQALASTVASLEATVQALGATVQTREDTIQSLEAALARSQANVQTLEANVQTLEATVQSLEDTVQRGQAERGRLAAELAQTQADLSRARVTSAILERDLGHAQAQLAAAEFYAESLVQERREQEEAQRILSRTRAWRLLQAYWSLAGRLKGR